MCCPSRKVGHRAATLSALRGSSSGPHSGVPVAPSSALMTAVARSAAAADAAADADASPPAAAMSSAGHARVLRHETSSRLPCRPAWALAGLLD